MEKKQKRLASLPIILNFIVFVGLLVFAVWLVFRDQDINDIIKVLLSANPFFLLLCIACMVGYFSMEAWNVMTLLRSFGEKISFFKSLRFTLIGFFFCSVTPGASGGQPLEIYYMSKEKISTANATLAILIQTCGIQFAVTGIGLICAIFGNDFLSGSVAILFAIGLMINTFALFILLISIFFTGGLRRFLRRFFGFLWRHGFKKSEVWLVKAEGGLDKYMEGSRYVREHKKEFWQSILKVVGQMTLFYLIPFFIYLSFGLHEMNVFEFFAMQSILFVSTCILPIPGAVGVSEQVFLTLYGAAFGETVLSSAVLLHRGISFYLFVVLSMFVVLITMIVNSRRRIKEDKK